MTCLRRLHRAIIARDSEPAYTMGALGHNELESRGRCALLIYLLALVGFTKR
jgi:hypothetical protein